VPFAKAAGPVSAALGINPPYWSNYTKETDDSSFDSTILDRMRSAYKEPRRITRLFLWIFTAHFVLVLVCFATLLLFPDCYCDFILLLTFPLCSLMDMPTSFALPITIALVACINGTRWGAEAALSEILLGEWWLLPLVNIAINALLVAYLIYIGPIQI
jgi:hypothetical protein